MTRPGSASRDPSNPPVSILDNIARWLRDPLVLAGLSLLLIAPVGLLAFNAGKKIATLATASSDSAQWTWSQLEVEFLKLEATTSNAMSNGDVEAVRRAFDVLYNRTTILRTMVSVIDHVETELLREKLASIAAVLETAVPTIESTDAALLAELPVLSAMFADIRPPVRDIALAFLPIIASASDRQRETVRLMLLSVTVATSLLLLFMLVSILLLSSLSAKLREKTRDAEATANWLRAVVRASTDAIVVSDDEGRIVDFNAAAERIFGYSRPEIIGYSMPELIFPSYSRATDQTGVARYLSIGKGKLLGRGRVRLEATRKSGELFPIELSIDSAEVPDGEIIVSYIRDLSSEKEAERLLHKAQDDARAGEKAKTDILAVMSHEIRTPLNGIMGTLELIKKCDPQPDFADYLRMIETSAKILLRHINDVLEISKLDANPHEWARASREFVLEEIVAEVIDVHQSLAVARGNELENTSPREMGPVVGDPEMLRQILINLISNAVKFTWNGRVTIEARRADADDVVEFRVCDNGIGIAPQNIERIFDDFFMVDPTYGRTADGTGLGLAITARLLRSVNGKIAVQSTLGEGSMFHVRLPLPRAEAPQGAPSKTVTVAHDAKYSVAPLDILVVEDNPINQRIVHDLMVRLGHNVTVAEDGLDAVRAAMRARFDVILMDIGMPRMDGIEASRRIRVAGRSRLARIIAVTAHARPQDISRFLAAGLDAVITKPFNMGQLLDALTEGKTMPSRKGRGGNATLAGEDPGSDLVDLMGQEGADWAWTTFAGQCDALMKRLDELASGRECDVEDLERIHQLCGTAAVLGASEIASQLRRIEGTLTIGEVYRQPYLLNNIIGHWRATQVDGTRAGLGPLKSVIPR